MQFRRRRHKTWKGLTAGILGGVAGALTMNLFQQSWTQLSKELNPSPSEESQGAEESEDATMKIAGKLSNILLGKDLSHDQKKKLGPVIHYSFGALTGGIYGALSERLPSVNRGLGIPFGAAVFLAADEIAVPAFGLSKSPSEYPLSTHATSLAAHCVYGMTAEVVRCATRHWL